MNRKIKQEESGQSLPEIRLKECELFELAHVVRIRPVSKDGRNGNAINYTLAARLKLTFTFVA